MSPPCLESQSSHLIPFYYLLSCASAHSYCSFCLLSFLSTYWPILLTFPPKILVWLLFSSQEIIFGRQYVQHAAIWHWYLPLCVYIIIKQNCFCPFPFYIDKVKKKSGKKKSDETPRYQNVQACCAFLAGVITDGLFPRNFLFDVCLFCLYLYRV